MVVRFLCEKLNKIVYILNQISFIGYKIYYILNQISNISYKMSHILYKISNVQNICVA